LSFQFLQSNNITYTQSATNNGPTSITIGGTTTVTFTDTIPANTTLAAAFAAPAGWTCNNILVGGTGTFTCTLNSGQSFNSGASVNFPLVVKVNAATAPGTTITNAPHISSTVSDPNAANNHSYRQHYRRLSNTGFCQHRQDRFA